MWNRIHVLFGDYYTKLLGLPGGSDRKEFVGSAGCWGLILGSGRSPAEGNGNPLQYSCLENSVDRGAWCCKESDMTERLTHTHTYKVTRFKREGKAVCFLFETYISQQEWCSAGKRRKSQAKRVCTKRWVRRKIRHSSYFTWTQISSSIDTVLCQIFLRIINAIAWHKRFVAEINCWSYSDKETLTWR